MVKVRALYLKLPNNYENNRRDFPAQLARGRFGITLELSRFARGEALRSMIQPVMSKTRIA